jgi:hypothetical protein
MLPVMPVPIIGPLEFEFVIVLFSDVEIVIICYLNLMLQVLLVTSKQVDLESIREGCIHPW